MRRILVLRGGALGDFIVTLPALRLLRERWPAAEITLIGNATAAQLGRHAGVIDIVRSQHDARWSALHDKGALPTDLADWLGGFDLVVNYWPDPDGALARHFPRHPAQRYLTAPALPQTGPAAAHYAAPLAGLGIVLTDPQPRLTFPGSRSAMLALHPGSGSPRKNWPAARWREVCARIDAPWLIIGGEAEAEVRDTFAPYGECLFGRPLLEVAERLAGCRGFLGHDSGIAHLAAAVGTPCGLLFGPTDPAIWAPPGPQVRVLRREAGLDAITVDDVVEMTKRHFFAAQVGPA